MMRETECRERGSVDEYRYVSRCLNRWKAVLNFDCMCVDLKTAV